MPKTVTFLGLGTMGYAMSNNLLKAGFAVLGYDPMPEARAKAEANGVRTFDSAAEAVQGAEAVCSAVPTPDNVIALYTGENGALSGAAEGTVCFDFSTITPEASCFVAGEAQKRGVIFLDTPVSGSAPRAIAADLAIMAGGDPEALEKHRDVLMAMVRSITHFGENGSGLRMKLVANHLVSGQLCLLAEALTLGHKTGLPMDAMADYLFEGGVFEVIENQRTRNGAARLHPPVQDRPHGQGPPPGRRPRRIRPRPDPFLCPRQADFLQRPSPRARAERSKRHFGGVHKARFGRGVTATGSPRSSGRQKKGAWPGSHAPPA